MQAVHLRDMDLGHTQLFRLLAYLPEDFILGAKNGFHIARQLFKVGAFARVRSNILH